MKIVAVDFDGVIVKNCYPKIGEPNKEIIEALKVKKSMGYKLVLWTCRGGMDLLKAVNYCESLGLTFDAVNENIPEAVEEYHNDCRKVGALEYWEDRAVHPDDIIIYKQCKRAIASFGMDAQLVVAMEELAELIQAISKFYRGKGDIENFAEEIADVEILLEQLKQIASCRQDVMDWKMLKINRLRDLLDNPMKFQAGVHKK